MARARTVKEYRSFVQGLVTEASPLTFPENASIDEANFVLNRDGSRRRRLGMDYEASYSLSSDISESIFSDQAVVCYNWKNADNSGLYNFAVVQVGETIHFYDNTQSSVSANKKSFTIDLNTFKAPLAASVGNDPIQVTSGKGALFIVSKSTEPFLVTYDSTADTISTSQIDVQIRDFEGVDDGLEVDENPSSLSNLHRYNLYNQGWDASKVSSYYTDQSEYPANSQVWTDGKDSNDVFDPSELVKTYFGSTPAPKGHFILDAFSQDRSTASGVGGISTVVEENRPSDVAFYAGRVWYGGIESETNTGQSLNSNIYYSRLLTNYTSLADEAGKCYQEADPTSEDISDLIATDGGVISIPEAGIIRNLVPVRNSLLVIADNGVWEISGDLEGGFTATTNQVIKVTNIGAVGPNSTVTVEDSVLFWSDGGIYIVQPDQTGRQLRATNISEPTIQTLYTEIPSISKRYAVGSYDPTTRKISWLYNDDDSYDGTTYRYKFKKELILDTVLSAFYKHEIGELDSDSPYVAGYSITPSLIRSTRDLNVVSSGTLVEASADQVFITETNQARGAVSTKYLTVVPQAGGTNSKITFSLYNNNDFFDWELADTVGIDYTSYLVTGYELFDDSMRDKQIDYLIAHFNVTETGFVDSGGVGLDYENPSSCKMRVRWEFSDSAASNRWSDEFEAYRLQRLYIPADSSDTFDYGFSTISTKNKVRGNGRSLSLYISSSPGKDMHLLGWGLQISGVTDV